MKSIGIITIHKINNYGSVLQAYALQKVCEDFGYEVEIIDYDFPNNFHQNNKYANVSDTQQNEPKLIKALFAKSLIKQHKGISSFVKKYQNLSDKKYHQVEDFTANPPSYDVYITGSDQLWSPRHCNGDPAFMLYFAPDNALKISYAASIGSNAIPEELKKAYIELLSRYKHISVRENTGADVIRSLIGKDATVVLDPTLLLNRDEWNKIATPKRLVRKKYILCYFLNYTFNAFPYVDELAKDIQRQTGYEIVRVARPPHKLSVGNTTYKIDASPEDFLALIRDAEIVLTTSFHGTAFAVNYAKPVFTVVQDRNASDSRQVSLMQNLGLDRQVLSVKDEYPTVSDANYNVEKEQAVLNQLRLNSKLYLEKALKDE